MIRRCLPWIAIPGLILLVGCVTPQDLVQRKPTMDFAAKMDAREAVTSISTAWSTHTPQVTVLPNGDGYTVRAHALSERFARLRM
jgi:hypothetical protein